MSSLANQVAKHLPNLITAVRILGSPGLIVLAINGNTGWLACLALFLVFTEWVDGFLARRLAATSVLGARLDTIADAAFYSCLLLAVLLLNPSLVAGQWAWIAAAVVSYGLSWLASWLKFGRLPSYHTYAAKGVWVLVCAGIVCLLGDISPWPFRLAMLCVAIANIEAIAITNVLSECRVDIPTIWHARRAKRRAGADSPDHSDAT
jgi:CDP-diacylglycerol--glycerol-3-phosphate 3-phosphatidyltransferase